MASISSAVSSPTPSPNPSLGRLFTTARRFPASRMIVSMTSETDGRSRNDCAVSAARNALCARWHSEKSPSLASTLSIIARYCASTTSTCRYVNQLFTTNAMSCLTRWHSWNAPSPPKPFTPCPLVNEPGVVVHLSVPLADFRLNANHASSSANAARLSRNRYWNR